MKFAAALQQFIGTALLRKGGSAMSQVDSSPAKKSTELTLIDKLSRLSYQQTLKLLGSDGPKLLRAGDSWDFRIEEDVYLNEDLFSLKFPLAPGATRSPASSPAPRCAGANRATRIARVLTSARTRSGPASISCTCLRN